jgi:hypothetical protein
MILYTKKKNESLTETITHQQFPKIQGVIANPSLITGFVMSIMNLPLFKELVSGNTHYESTNPG